MGTRKIALCVTCLLYKQTDQSSSPQHTCYKAGVGVGIYNSKSGRGVSRDKEAQRLVRQPEKINMQI